VLEPTQRIVAGEAEESQSGRWLYQFPNCVAGPPHWML